ncbi:F-box/LRR-repeat protein 25-like protein [Tanacetum coccineum]
MMLVMLQLIIEKSSNSSVAAMETLEEEVQNQPNELTPKPIKIDEEKEKDRISPMLDCLILEIISRLPTTKEAIRTGTPSNDGNIFDLLQQLVSLCCNVEELTLVLWSKDMEAQFVLDKLFFISSSFTHLKLKDCILNPNGAISWNKLMSLSLQFVELDEDLIQNILSGCPILETLRFGVYAMGILRSRLRYNFKSVKKLVFVGILHPGNDTEMIEINAPNIISLTIENMLSLRKLVLLNVSSLVKAKLNYRNAPDLLSDKENEEMLKEFILSLRHVKELTIGKYCQKIPLNHGYGS